MRRMDTPKCGTPVSVSVDRRWEREDEGADLERREVVRGGGEVSYVRGIQFM